MAVGGVSTPRAPIGATASMATNSLGTYVMVSLVIWKVSQTLLLTRMEKSNSSVNGFTCNAERFKKKESESNELVIVHSCLSALQMWMSVRSRESVCTAAVLIWMAPTSASVTPVTKSLQTAGLVKVCKILSGDFSV